MATFNQTSQTVQNQVNNVSYPFEVSIEIGLVDSWQKDILEDILTGISFKQRKNYDEYYINWKHGTIIELTSTQIRVLSEDFTLEIIGERLFIK